MPIDHLSVPNALEEFQQEIMQLSRMMLIAFLSLAVLGALLWPFSGYWIWLLGLLAGGLATQRLRARIPPHLQTLDRLQREREQFFMGILDACEQPCSVTALGKPGDKQWHWLYVNGPVQAAFGKPLSEFLGQPCHQWGANICKTQNCGRECLERGQPESLFAQDFGAGLNHFRVYTKTLNDLSGQPAYVAEWVDPHEELRFQMLTSSDRVTDLSTKTAQATQEVSGNIKSVAAAAEQLSYSTLEISRSAETAVTTVGNVENITQQVGSEAQGAAEAIQTLAGIGEQISDMSTVIRGIANQTNLLALNASIESARAGEQGRGFAVVASEVKQLAQKTQDATQQIAEKTEETRLQITDNVTRIVSLSERITEASRQVAGVRSDMQSVAASVTEQNVAVDEIARNAAEAAQATDETIRLTESVLTAAKELRQKVQSE
ncbi:methyl-accepting chemotaxis protein [Rhabdochromatium marinum]|uniref:methyl-accepting chemotaxis protein n=1 Tax=Rhabdochromatium marinum TaxID=48729 RepID=UPI001906858A|nr:methyl-accepting chemotaxis protein [Rhabdochromatium marinum]MBK1650501.1 chemotaxis protein [Rhabdochromatium marinum]